MKRTTLVVALWALFAATSSAQKGGTEQDLAKEAKTLFDAGQYLKAYPLYSQLVSLYPQNPDYNYRFGACAIYSDPDKTKAIRYLTIAGKKGANDPMVGYYLGKAYHLNYQFKEAVKSYEDFVAKADPKVVAKTDAQREIETCIYGSNLLSNIKDVVVINKTEADKANFFRYMNLEGIGGKILTVPDALQSKLDQKAGSPGVIHYPGNSTTIYFSSYGKDGATGKDIYKAQILPDGKFSEPVKLKGDVNTKYDEDFAFMHSDGKTLYFSSKGHNSMGGYDIFKTTYDPNSDSFGPAINLDFAINTPDDDIFYIADSLNKHAYFASGRTSDLDHMHVYNVMVEGIPLQVVYMKGTFNSLIDAEQKIVKIQIKDDNTGRIVMETVSNKNSGAYLSYVNKSGDYTYSVKTENSPTEHKAHVHVPVFDKPVAVRQEMVLSKEGGQEKLEVRTYFEEILNEDLSALAAEMLRAKAGLDVNAGSVEMPKTEQKETVAKVEELSVEKTMSNAPLAAGFASGVSTESILAEMEKAATSLQTFTDEAGKKEANSYAYALKKQKEADAALLKAEELRASAGNYGTAEDMEKLRESYKLTMQAQVLKREARSAMVAAESVIQYRSVEAERAQALQKTIAQVKEGLASSNFDLVYSGLKAEKQRQTEMRAEQTSPYQELMAKARAKESAKRSAEDKLVTLRDNEQKLMAELKIAENRLANAKKKDQPAAENTVAELSGKLMQTRREIKVTADNVETLSEEVNQEYVNANMFKQVSENTGLDLTQNEQVKLDDIQRQNMSKRIAELDTRIDALKIKDPQMLAMVTEGMDMTAFASDKKNSTTGTTSSSEQTSAASSNESSSVALSDTTNNVATNVEASDKQSTSATTTNNADVAATKTDLSTTSNGSESKLEQTANVEANGLTPSSAAPTQNEGAVATNSEKKTEETNTNATATGANESASDVTPTAPLANAQEVSKSEAITASAIKSSNAKMLETLGNKPELAVSRKMVIANGIANADVRIAELKSKKAGTLSTTENQELAALTNVRKELSAQLKAEESSLPTPPPTSDELTATFMTVVPDYRQQVQTISNGAGGQLKKTAALLELKSKTLASLENNRIANSDLAMKSKDAGKLAEFAERDAQLASAISFMKSETTDLYAYTSAFQNDNATIINADVEFEVKKQAQLAEAKNYVALLSEVEKEKQAELKTTADAEEVKAINTMLAEIKKEKTETQAKINSYTADLKTMGAQPMEAKAALAMVMPAAAEVATMPTAENAIKPLETPETTDGVNTLANVTVKSGNTGSWETSATPSAPVTPLAEEVKTTEAETNATAANDGSENAKESVASTADLNTLEATASNTEQTSTTPEAVPSTIVETPSPEILALTPKQKTDLAIEKVADDAKMMKVLFAPKPEISSIFAYESGDLQSLVEEHSSDTLKMKNAEKIKDVNQEIFLVEAEIEIENNEDRQKKLDREAEQLYLKRSGLEISNAMVIGKMTQLEYEQELANTQKALDSNKDIIESRILLRDEVSKMMASAASDMEEAEALRKQAGPVEDNIEKNDLYRRAYAKEMHAVNMLRQVQMVSKNAEPLLAYDEQQLTTLRYGTKTDMESMAVNLAPTFEQKGMLNGMVPHEENPLMASNAAAEKANDIPVAATGNNGGATLKSTGTAEPALAENTTKVASTETAVQTELVAKDQLTNTNSDATATKAEQNASTEAVAENAAAVLTSEERAEVKAAVENNTLTEAKAELAVNNSEVQVAATQAENKLKDEEAAKAEIAKQEASNALANYASPAFTATEQSTSINKEQGNETTIGAALAASNVATTSSEGVGKGDKTKTRSEKTESKTSDKGNDIPTFNNLESMADYLGVGSFDPKTAGFYEYSDATEYFYNTPEYLYMNLFVRTPRPVYNEKNPIPVDGKMPSGICYMVQIGAFRNKIPQNLYDEFAPVRGESVGNGITRYTAGFFLSYEAADKTKMDIRGVGYPDAFVVAYRDGKRIPLYEAMGKSEPDFQASVEKEYVKGDGAKQQPAASLTAPKEETAPVATAPVATNTAPVAKRTDYYKGVANAAPATLVEATEGLFFTVQVGVYSKPVSLDKVFNLSELNTELTKSEKIRYTSGRFTSLQEAVGRRVEAREKGVADAFIVAYYNGEKISLNRADELLKEKGDSILMKK
jgi:hypothetical protein